GSRRARGGLRTVSGSARRDSCKHARGSGEAVVASAHGGLAPSVERRHCGTHRLDDRARPYVVITITRSRGTYGRYAGDGARRYAAEGEGQDRFSSEVAGPRCGASRTSHTSSAGPGRESSEARLELSLGGEPGTFEETTYSHERDRARACGGAHREPRRRSSGWLGRRRRCRRSDSAALDQFSGGSPSDVGPKSRGTHRLRGDARRRGECGNRFAHAE